LPESSGSSFTKARDKVSDVEVIADAVIGFSLVATLWYIQDSENHRHPQ
jgi:hypothetical protein